MIAVCIVGGMLLGTPALLLLVPTLFCLFEWLEEKWRGKV